MCYGNIFERSYSGNYIPDLTERYPEGFRTFDEPYCGYESDGEIVLDEEEIIMKDMNFTQLNKELINRGIVFEPHPIDEYQTCCYLHSIHEWGFITITYCETVDNIFTFYDWECQSILYLDINKNTNYEIINGIISVNYVFHNETKSFCYDLKKGAPIHFDDITTIGYDPSEQYGDKRFYAINDGRLYYKENCKDLELVNDFTCIANFLDNGFELIESDSYKSNIDILNNMLIRI